MESIKEIFRIGYGPSSSHTMAPRRASELFLRDHKAAARFEITLFGALAATGKGHLTDKAILDVLGQDRTKIIWKADTFLDLHPNAMQFEAFDNEDNLLDSRKYYSIGGGKIIRDDSNEGLEINEVYPHHSLTEILQYLDENGLTFWEYVQEFEHAEIWDYLAEVLAVMKKSVEDGLNEEGVLPGGLRLRRKAMSYYTKARSYKPSLKGRCLVQSYALAVSEQNAAGGLIVTAPTCGSCGVVPAVLYHLSKEHEFTDKQIIRSLATAGLFGSIIKHNASISGAEVGYSGYEYFDIGNNCGFQVQHYGINQSSSDKITEIYYFDGEHYTLIDSTGDNYANHNVLCDGERLYYLISDGILRSIDKTGSQTDYRDIYNTEEFYCPHIIMNGTENGIELIGYSTVTGEKEEIGIVEIK